MGDVLEVTHRGQHRKDRFDDHAHIPASTRTHFQVGWVALLGEEAMVVQDEHFIFESADQGMKNGVIDVGGGTVQAVINPNWFKIQHSLPPTIQR